MNETHIHLAVHAYNDPGPGGWAAIVVTPEGRRHTLGGHRTLTGRRDLRMSALGAAMERSPRGPEPNVIHARTTPSLREHAQRLCPAVEVRWVVPEDVTPRTLPAHPYSVHPNTSLDELAVIIAQTQSGLAFHEAVANGSTERPRDDELQEHELDLITRADRRPSQAVRVLEAMRDFAQEAGGQDGCDGWEHFRSRFLGFCDELGW